MNKGIVIGVIIGIIIGVVIGFFVFNQDKNDNGKIPYGDDGLIANSSKNNPEQPVQTCNIEGSYCYYNNIPERMKFTKSSEKLEADSLLSWKDADIKFSKIMEKVSSDPRADSFSEAIYLPEFFVCKISDKKPVVVKYYEYNSNCPMGVTGCYNHPRSALVCGDVYFVSEISGTGQTVFYGPFYLS